MNQYHHVRNNLFLLKHAWLAKFFGRQAEWRILTHSRKNWDVSICLILSELAGSKSPRYSRELLLLLDSVPDDVLESHAFVKSHFMVGPVGVGKFKSVREALDCCETVLYMCFKA